MIAAMPLPLRTERLELRPFTDDDVPAMHRIYADREVMRYVATGAVSDSTRTRAILREYARRVALDGRGFLAVVDRASGEVIGDAGLEQRDAPVHEVELGYTLARAWWGRGLATEAAAACVAYAFGELGMDELIAMVEPPNAASAHVLEKLGFTRDGRRKALGREHHLYRLRRPQR
jgi:[ribosomal protein S5]-alanine N-acetyltransferase